MNTDQIVTHEDFIRYIEGILNDFELGITDKNETINVFLDLVIKNQKALKEGKHLKDV